MLPGQILSSLFIHWYIHSMSCFLGQADPLSDQTLVASPNTIEKKLYEYRRLDQRRQIMRMH